MSAIEFPGISRTRATWIFSLSIFLGFCVTLLVHFMWTPLIGHEAESLCENSAKGNAILSKNEKIYDWIDNELEYNRILLDGGYPALFEVVFRDSHRGNAYAHYVLGALYASKVGLERDMWEESNAQALAVLHYTIAAEESDSNAMLALAYRHEHGYGVPVDCAAAASYYGRVAKNIVEVAVDETIIPSVANLMLDEENEKHHSEASKTNMLQYGELQAAQGNGRYHLAVGYTYLFGILGQSQNGVHAETHFLQALRQGHSAAYGALGQLYSKGAPGISTNATAAFDYFLSGAREGDVSSLNGLGTFFAKGVVVQRNVTKAVQYYKLSAFHGNPEAHYNLGIVYLNGIEDVLDVESAKHHLSLASEKGMLLARYTLGTLYEKGVGVDRSCAKAVDLYKAVLKEGPRERRLKRAHDFYRNGMSEAAFFNYLLSAENGQPQAELNLGILIGKQKFDFSSWNIPEIPATQLNYYHRSAAQGTRSALVRVGDVLYQENKKASRCTRRERNKTQPECSLFLKLQERLPYSDLSAWAAQYYRDAEIQRSAYAAYALGWMHHFGPQSIERDIALAKQYYDLAIIYDSSASLPVRLLLAMLHAEEYVPVRKVKALVQMLKNSSFSYISFNVQLRFFDFLWIFAFIFVTGLFVARRVLREA